MHTGRGGIGSHKHGISGTPGHNRAMHQIARELNKQAEQRRRQRQRQHEPLFDSVAALMHDMAGHRRRKPHA